MPFRPLLAAIAALLVLAPAARAEWFAAETVDGPSAEIAGLGEVDMARDATGALVYLKRENGVPHVFLSRLAGGAWQPPERVDQGIEAGASQPVVAAGDDHRLAIVWLADGKVFGTVAAGGAGTPLAAPQVLHADPAGPVLDPDVDLAVNGTAYAVFSAPGAGGRDVRAARVRESTWEPVPAPLDIGPDQPAGDGAGRPRVAVSADGYAVAAWGEGHPDGRRRVYGRRITGLTLSVAPQEISLPDLAGEPGGDADSGDIDIEDDGSFCWVVFRQDFGGRSRAVARRLVGSLFEAPTPIDGGATAAAPRLAMSGRGIGVAAVGEAAANAVQATLLELGDAFSPALRIDSLGSEAATVPVVGASERDERMVAWRRQAGALTEVRARRRADDSDYGPEALLSVPELGPVGTALAAGESRTGDFVVAFEQGAEGERRIVVATWDEVPGLPIPISTENWQRRRRPTLKWRAGSELMGPQLFNVYLGAELIATTPDVELRLPRRLRDGLYTWQVIATDRRGQEKPSRSRRLRVDARKPRVRVRVRGRVVRVLGRDGEGSEVRRMEVGFGDGTVREIRGTVARHRYARPGRYRVSVVATDRARNVARRSVRIRVR